MVMPSIAVLERRVPKIPNPDKEKYQICISRQRQAYWSEAIAIGDVDWLKGVVQKSGIKRYTIKSKEVEDKNAYIHFLAEGKIALRGVYSDFMIVLSTRSPIGRF
jgi:hypothetical protein